MRNAKSPQSIKLTVERAAQKGKSLTRANLAWAHLEWAHLEGAHLERAHLEWANLAGAHLEGANLEGAHLEGACLEGANLEGACLPSPAIVISASWGNLSDNVTIALMRLDASGHPDPTAFDRWGQGGNCPYTNALVQRVANFTERRDLWSPGPPPTLWEAMCMVLDEKCPGWRRKENENGQLV